MDYSFEDFMVYKQYLNTITKQLDIFFEDQKEYICCKKGCSLCCEKGEYPYSDLEFKYLLLGLFKIENKERLKVLERIRKLKKEYSELENKEKFHHRCPFLTEEKTCSVYEYRGLICRTFGLLTEMEDGNYTLPFCSTIGLNYSEVYNSKDKIINYDLIKEKGYKSMPRAKKTNIYTLTSKEIFKSNPIEFGEIKPLIEWL